MKRLFDILTEGRQDDLVEQLHASISSKLDESDAEKMIMLSKNAWNELRRDRNFSLLPNKWKVFFAELHKARISREIFEQYGQKMIKSKFDINDSYVKQGINNVSFFDEIIDIFKNYGDANLQSYNPLLAVSPTSAKEGIDAVVEDYKKKMSMLVIPEGDEKLLFDLGDFKWFDLQKNVCNIEGEAMGHCGNSHTSGEHETVLSLRKVVTVGEKVYHRPSLTFILDKANGFLIETRGRANTKPKKSYHPYIIELFRDKRIKGIELRYEDAKNNFVIGDLNSQQLEKLYSIRPDLKEKFEAMKLLDNHFLEVLEGKATKDIEDKVTSSIHLSGKYSLMYAKHMGKAFPKGENSIATLSPQQIFDYSKIIGKRFKKGEHRIVYDLNVAVYYHERFVKAPWNLLENAIMDVINSLTDDDFYEVQSLAADYAQNSGQRFLRYEKTLFENITTNSANIVVHYLYRLNQEDAYEALKSNINDFDDFAKIFMKITSYSGISIDKIDFIKKYIENDIEDEKVKESLTNVLKLIIG